nr:unnamed protein product [Callosobruchus analis]
MKLKDRSLNHTAKRVVAAEMMPYGFEIHDLKSDTGHFYTYHKGQASKGPNEVCSFIHGYIKNMHPEVQELQIFAGQNRNHTVARFLLYLVPSRRFRKTVQHFPVHGHSFLPCDRDLGSVKPVIRRRDRIYLPEDYEHII